MREPTPSEPDRFLALLKPLERDLEWYCRRLIWDAQSVPDALQNAVLRAFAAFDRYHEDASFRAWMFKILTNEVFTLNRKHARVARHEFQLEPEELAALLDAAPAGESAGEPLTGPALADALDENLVTALKTLTDAERAVLLQRALAGLRYREIAEALEMPLGSVMGHLSRARQKMRAGLARLASRNPLPQTKPL